VFEDGVGGDALNAVVVDLTSDFSQGSGPRAGWLDGLALSQAQVEHDPQLAKRRILPDRDAQLDTPTAVLVRHQPHQP
jgi:hypothetical protein